MQREGIRNRAGATAVRLALVMGVILNATGAVAAPVQEVPTFVASVTAPDTVLFTGSIPGGVGAKIIEFGDGTSGGIPIACSGPGQSPCPLAVIPVSQSHRYDAGGTYEVRVKDVVRGTIIARTTVTVEGRPEIVIDPHAWIAKVSVEPELGRPLAVTLKCGDDSGNICSNPKNRVEWGDGTTARLQIQPGYGDCNDPLMECLGPYFYARHTYGKPGVYTVIVKDSDYAPCGPLEDCPSPIVGTATVTVGLQLIDR